MEKKLAQKKAVVWIPKVGDYFTAQETPKNDVRKIISLEKFHVVVVGLHPEYGLDTPVTIGRTVFDDYVKSGVYWKAPANMIKKWQAGLRKELRSIGKHQNEVLAWSIL